MSSVRVLFAEVEGSDETVRSVLHQFADRVQARPPVVNLPVPAGLPVSEPAPKPLAIAPVAEAPVRRKIGRPTKRSATVPRNLQASLPGLKESPAQDVVRAQLAKRPLTSGDLIQALQPDVKAGKIGVDGRTIWCRKEEGEKERKCRKRTKQSGPS